MSSFQLAMAQPAMNSFPVTAAGTSVAFKSKADNTLSSGASGANQTWDFSGVTFTNLAVTTQFVTPASTGYASDYPNANLSEKTAAGSYSFVGLKTTEQILYGYVDNSQGVAVKVVYSDPLKIITLPLAYNASFSDNFGATYSTQGFPTTITGTATTTYDGYGTIKTIYGTYNNVARLKLVKEESNVMNVSGFSMTTTTKSTSYSWYIPGSSHSLFSIMEVEMTSMGQSSGVQKSAIIFDQSATPVSTASLNTFEIAIGPNPVSDYLNIDLKDQQAGEYTFEMINESGVVAYVEKFNHEEGVLYMTNIASLPKGIYIATVRSKNGIAQEKLVKLK